ncbi:hypothetical protein [Bacillus sp. NPDC077027]|uniref:hypothetical protein n=1 Tax=Bacillus sp. NPDC077027 TaxID=3390548 RepID=UPI003D000E4D
MTIFLVALMVSHVFEGYVTYRALSDLFLLSFYIGIVSFMVCLTLELVAKAIGALFSLTKWIVTSLEFIAALIGVYFSITLLRKSVPHVEIFEEGMVQLSFLIAVLFYLLDLILTRLEQKRPRQEGS